MAKATAKADPARRIDRAAFERASGAAALQGNTGTVDRADRIAAGRALRKDVPRSSHGDWQAAADRPDPVAVLEAQSESRVPELLPIRHGRMAESQFGFFRGAAAGMAADLAPTPTTGIMVQLCGDAHLLNFGGFATPERRLIFDVNDFDETLPGPWEWDLKRLGASFAVAARAKGLPDEVGETAVLGITLAYAGLLAGFATAAHASRQRPVPGLDPRRDPGVDYYWRNLRDMKVSADVNSLPTSAFLNYAELCGGTLARAHARSGDAAAISGYLGKGDVFGKALGRFATSYADQNALDHAALVQAIKDGRVTAQSNV
jgi:Uncharacterized protein conserved in bacteria (DUF2252)